jgi:hypothetical protein
MVTSQGPIIPAHIQQQLQRIIRVLNEKIGQEATRAYFKSLCTDASLDIGKDCPSNSPTERCHTSRPSQIEEDTWRLFTFLDEDDMTEDTNGPFSSPYSDRIVYPPGQGENSPGPCTQDPSQTAIEKSEDISSPGRQLHEEILASVRETEMALEATDT